MKTDAKAFHRRRRKKKNTNNVFHLNRLFHNKNEELIAFNVSVLYIQYIEIIIYLY